MNEEIDNYALSLFNPSKYVKEECKEYYEEKAKSTGVAAFTQAKRENTLIGMMKINFLKRLESSVRSFAISMDRTIRKIEDLEDRINRFKKYKHENPELDFDEMQIDDVEDEELKEVFEVGKKLTFKLDDLNLDNWLDALKADKDQLIILLNAAEAVKPEDDAKLAELKKIITEKSKHPTITKTGIENRKILLFTAFSDTADYLYSNIAGWALEELGIHTALVTGGIGGNKSTFNPKGFKNQTDYLSILTNFSPISKSRVKMPKMPQEGELDLLIATDCISEGQNLQDCDYLVNYDIHWNPVRIIQRFGRIDRIGSVNKSIQLVNFWVTEDLNKYINLKNRVESRMALVDISATSEDNVLTMEELTEIVAEDLRYRDKQLLKLQDEVLDLEDFEDNISLTEFTLDDFRIELSNYIDANKEKLQQAPFGLNAVVPPSQKYKQIQPGVIFCLKQKGETKSSELVNPIQPFFLVYVLKDGNVRYSFMQTKQVLEIFRELCLGKENAIEKLCRLFDDETDQGRDMTDYSFLLKKTIESVTETFRIRAGRSLSSGRDAMLVQREQQPKDVDDFQLVTWLVIKK